MGNHRHVHPPPITRVAAQALRAFFADPARFRQAVDLDDHCRATLGMMIEICYLPDSRDAADRYLASDGSPQMQRYVFPGHWFSELVIDSDGRIETFVIRRPV